jgi:hypothetical protein
LKLQIWNKGNLIKEIENPYPDLNENEPIYLSDDGGLSWIQFGPGYDNTPYDDDTDNEGRPWKHGEQRDICKRLTNESLISHTDCLRFPNGRVYYYDGHDWVESTDMSAKDRSTDRVSATS